MRNPIHKFLLIVFALGGCRTVSPSDMSAASLAADDYCHPDMIEKVKATESSLDQRCISDFGRCIWTDIITRPSLKPFEGTRSTNNEAMAPFPLVRGEAIIDGMQKAILSAQSEILIQFYDITESSWTAGQIKEALNQAITRNPQLKVYVMVNANTGIETLGMAEDRVSGFLGNSQNITVAGHFGDNPALVNHAKYIIIDQQTVVMTDTNLQSNADPVGMSKKALGWNQMAIVVRGDIAKPLREEFMDAWSHQTEHPDWKPEAFTGSQSFTGGCSHMMLASKGEGDGDRYPGPQMFQSTIHYARKEVRIMTPNMNSSLIMPEIKQAITRNQRTHPDFKVKVLLSYKFNEKEMKLVGGTNEDTLKKWQSENDQDIYRCGMEVRWYSDESGQIVEGNGPNASHAKYLSADGQVMILGSYNLDEQTFNRSREMAVLVDDSKVTQAFDDEFNKIWERSKDHKYDMGCPH